MKKLLRQASSSVIEQFVQPISNLVVGFELMRTLGAEQFGFFSITLTLLAMGPLLGLGISAFIVREVAHRSRTGGMHAVAQLLRESIAILLVVSVFVGIVTFAAVALFFPVSDLSRPVAASFSLVIILGVACGAIQEFDLLFGGTLKGLSCFGLSSLIEVCGRILWLVSTCFGAYLFGLEGALSASCAVLFVKAVIKGLVCANLTHGPRIFVPSIHVDGVVSLLRGSIWLWIQAVGGILFFSVDRLIVGGMFGPAAMGGYVVCAQIAAFGLMLPAAAGQALVPWVIHLHANGGAPRYGWHKAFSFLSAICMAPGLVVVFLSYFLLYIFMGQGFAESHWMLLAIFAMGVAMVAAAVPFHFGLLALGVTRPVAVSNVFGGLLSVIAGVALGCYGINFFVLGKLLFALPLVILPYWFFNKILSGRSVNLTAHNGSGGAL